MQLRESLGEHVIPPAIAVEVRCEKTAGVINFDGIYAERACAPQVCFHGPLVERRESLMEALGALHLGLIAYTRTPFVVASGRVSALPGFLIFPPLREYRTARAEQVEKQGNLFLRCAWGSRQHRLGGGTELELPLGLKNAEFVLNLDGLGREFCQSPSEIGRA